MADNIIRSYRDLVTSSRAIRNGFLEQALLKTKEAQPYLVDAHRLRAKLRESPHASHLFSIEGIREQLAAAAGFSEKARGYFSETALTSALKKALRTIEQEAGSEWREEILYRFLLTMGAKLAGSMRNTIGALAQRRFADALIATLAERGVSHEITRSPRNKEKIKRIQWSERLLLFDMTPKFIGKNIDAILLKEASHVTDASDSQRLSCREDYIACGELKGGIDPAGADEHWKTARSALERIRSSFPDRHPPHLFFVAAAIAESMAQEIFAQLQSGELGCAANITVPKQLSALASWLSTL